MPLRKVLQYFHGVERPFFLDVPDIERQILKHISHHSIMYVEHTGKPSSPLHGMLDQQHVKIAYDDEPMLVSNIHYKKTSTKEQIRFICCKELLHILDPVKCKTHSLEGLNDLISDMCSSVDVLTNKSSQTAQDYGNVVLAASVFISNEMRTEALKAIEMKKLTIRKFADALMIPIGAVRIVLREDWPKRLKDQMEILYREADPQGDEEEAKYYREMKSSPMKPSSLNGSAS